MTQSRKQARRQAAKARRRKYIELRDRMRTDPSDFNRFQWACRVPMLRQVEIMKRLIEMERPIWTPPGWNGDSASLFVAPQRDPHAG